MLYKGNSKVTWSTFQTLEKTLQETHNYKYTYDKAIFINARTPMIITCPVHGDFEQRSRDHKRGQGCRKCFEQENAENRTKDINVLVDELNSISRFTYPDLSNAVAIKAHDRVLTKCVECGTEKRHKVCNILTGHSGCLVCNHSRNLWTAERYEGKKTILYYVRIGSLYKIGLTRKSVAARYYKELAEGYDIEVVFTMTYNNGSEAFKEEQRILKQYSKFKYKGEKMLINGGDSELFTINIFNNGGVPSTL